MWTSHNIFWSLSIQLYNTSPTIALSPFLRLYYIWTSI
jgi:hypothetical protein